MRYLSVALALIIIINIAASTVDPTKIKPSQINWSQDINSQINGVTAGTSSLDVPNMVQAWEKINKTDSSPYPISVFKFDGNPIAAWNNGSILYSGSDETAAMDAAYAKGGEIVVYDEMRINTSGSAISNMVVRSGNYLAKLKANAESITIIDCASSRTFITLDGLTIDGDNRANVTGVNLQGTDFVISHCTIENCASNLKATGTVYRAWVHHNDIRVSSGSCVSGVFSDSIFDTNLIGGAASCAIDATGWGVVKIANNQIYSSETGIKAYDITWALQIIGNSIIETDHFGIQLEKSSGNADSASTIALNTLDKAGTMHSNVYTSIFVRGYSGNLISGNYVRDPGEYGIREYDADYNLFADNRVDYGTIGQLLIVGTHSQNSTNMVYYMP